MVVQPSSIVKFSCSHCGQAGVRWQADGAMHPGVSNGFHLQFERVGANNRSVLVCDLCDEIMDLRTVPQSVVAVQMLPIGVERVGGKLGVAVTRGYIAASLTLHAAPGRFMAMPREASDASDSCTL